MMQPAGRSRLPSGTSSPGPARQAGPTGGACDRKSGDDKMNSYSRRDFVRSGLAALGVGGLVLRADAQPTPSSGDLGAYAQYLAADDQVPAQPPARWAPTEDNILG